MKWLLFHFSLNLVIFCCRVRRQKIDPWMILKKRKINCSVANIRLASQNRRQKILWDSNNFEAGKHIINRFGFILHGGYDPLTDFEWRKFFIFSFCIVSIFGYVHIDVIKPVFLNYKTHSKRMSYSVYAFILVLKEFFRLVINFIWKISPKICLYMCFINNISRFHVPIELIDSHLQHFNVHIYIFRLVGNRW